VTILTTGTTTIADQSASGTNFIFAGTAADTAPTLQFLGGSTNPGGMNVTYFPGSFTTNGPGTNSSPSAFGNVTVGTLAPYFANDTPASVVVTNGVDLNNGVISVYETPRSVLTLDQNDELTNGGTLAVSSPRALGDFNINGTLTLGALGKNALDVGTVVLGGKGTIKQLGENDQTGIGWAVNSGVTLVADGGIISLYDVRDFKGTIGPAGVGPNGNSIGIFGEIALYGVSVTSATFDTSTGTLSLMNANGADVGDLHLAGNAANITLNKVTVSGSTYVALNEGGAPEQGNIPIKF
jgi:hypothetical protein